MDADGRDIAVGDHVEHADEPDHIGQVVEHLADGYLVVAFPTGFEELAENAVRNLCPDF